MAQHKRLWQELVISNRLKGWEDVQKESIRDENAVQATDSESFSINGFHKRLVRLVAATDQVSDSEKSLDECSSQFIQSLRFFDTPEIRNVFLYISDRITDRDIPHRTKLTELVDEEFKQYHESLVVDIKVSSFINIQSDESEVLTPDFSLPLAASHSQAMSGHGRI